MQRRMVLAALGAFGGLAGCAATPSGNTRTSTSGHATTARQSTESTSRTAVPVVGVPAPKEGCPTYEEVDRIACIDGDPPAGRPLVLEADPASISLPTDTIDFTLLNGTDATFETNYFSWRIHKRVAGDWYRVAPRTWAVPLSRLEPNGAHVWTITVDNTTIDRPIELPDSSEAATVIGLGGGEYAFGLDGEFEGDDRRTAVVTRFRVEGDRLEVTPTRNVKVRSVEDDALRAVEPVPEDEIRVTLTVTRATDADAPSGRGRRVITEQLLRRTMTRNAVALLHSYDVRRVRIEGPQHVAPAYDLTEPVFVRYDGSTYRLTADRTVP